MCKFLIFLSCILSTFAPVYAQAFEPSLHPLDNMPIVEPTPVGFLGVQPIEQRDLKYRKFLSASVKIKVDKASGSGTIVFYDYIKNLAYVASCGHMWNKGTMSVEEGKVNKVTCKVEVWYHNEKKLDESKTYDANVVFYSYIKGQDTSLVSFTPDWQPEYFPLASYDYEYIPGKHAHSLGSDGGSEVAHYDVEMIGLAFGDLVTYQNSPRPGRSGGGLLDDNGYYIGTCWGTQYQDGSGNGYFTPMSAIHNYWKQQKGYQFLLNQKPGAARQIRIKDRTTKQKKYSSEYILLPN